jgi:hypothetical protein
LCLLLSLVTLKAFTEVCGEGVGALAAEMELGFLYLIVGATFPELVLSWKKIEMLQK